jgi:hypothetical protein
MGKPYDGDKENEENGQSGLARIVLLSATIEIDQSRCDQEKRKRDDPVRDSMKPKHPRGRKVRIQCNWHEVFKQPA